MNKTMSKKRGKTKDDKNKNQFDKEERAVFNCAKIYF
jgi:hypothetical protein